MSPSAHLIGLILTAISGALAMLLLLKLFGAL